MFDVGGLRAFVSAAKQQHDRRTNLAKVDLIARTVIDAKLMDSITDTVAVAEISKAYSIQPNPNLCTGLGIPQRGEPLAERHPALVG